MRINETAPITISIIQVYRSIGKTTALVSESGIWSPALVFLMRPAEIRLDYADAPAPAKLQSGYRATITGGFVGSR